MSLTGNAKANDVLKGKINLLKTIKGYSAYEVAVINGFRGTEEEWLVSLEGIPTAVVEIVDWEESTVNHTVAEILEFASRGRRVVFRYPLGEPGSFMDYYLFRATSESVAFHAQADRFDNGDINIGMLIVHDGNHFYMDQIFINQEPEVEIVYDWEGESSLTTEEIYEKSCMGKAVILRDTGDFEHEETTDYALWHSDASSAEFRSPVFISDNGEASVKIVRVTAPNAVNREEKVISVTAESIKEALGYTPADEENAKQMVVTFAYDANGSLACTPGVADVFAAHRAGRTVVAVYEKARLTLSNAMSATLDFTAEDWLRAEYKMIRVSEAGSISYFTGKIADGKLDKNQGEENYGKLMGVNLRGEVVPVNLNLDKTLSIEGRVPDAKAVGDALGNKLDNDQGTTNAGKFLGIGADGKVAPVTLNIQTSVAKISEITLLAESWVERRDNLYAQTVEIEGVTENSQVDITPSVEQLVIFYEKDLGFVTENDGGEVTVYAIGQKPENDYTIQVTITEVIT